LLLAPWLARGLLPLRLLTTPYVRAGGLGQALAEHLPREQLPLVLAAHGLAMLLFGWNALLMLVAGGLLLVWLRRRMLDRLGGTTGDTAGAMVELVECALLVVIAL
ncbi:MAG: adenosylcobinamide-GDP ribazoletransferase, partial [Pseudomonas sp.]